MKSDDGAMRDRTKDCYLCNNAKQVLYRCRYDDLKDWVFICGKCLTDVKPRFEDTYQYGGTWKSKKKQAGAVEDQKFAITLNLFRNVGRMIMKSVLIEEKSYV